MKKLYIIPLTLLCIGCKSTWNNPTIEGSENDSPHVLSVTINDTATIIDMEKHLGYGFDFSDATILVTDEMNTVSLRRKDFLPKYNEVRNDSIVRFKLTFNALHKGVKRLDLIEGSSDRDFRIWGIRPKGMQLVEHVYNPSISELNENDASFLKGILNRHAGKNIVLQIVDNIELPESAAALRRTIHARKQFEKDERISFVTFTRPDNNKNTEDESKAIYIGGKTIFMEPISLEEYNHLVSIIKPYLSQDNTVCLTPALQILSPGLIFYSVKHLNEQLKWLSSQEQNYGSY